MSATAVYVAYGVETIDLSWIPDEIEVVIIENDDRLTDAVHPRLRRIRPGRNVGFGAAVNLALATIDTPRMVLCNPDTRLDRCHWQALVDAAPDEVVTVAQNDDQGIPTSVVNAYWSVPAFVATAYRLGRFLPRGGSARRRVTRLLGAWGRAHQHESERREWPLVSHWATGAVLSLPVDSVKAVGGFDERYFLYFEDADLQQRMATHDPSLRLRLADVEPAIHLVGGTAGPDEATTVARIRRESAARYAEVQPGPWWAVASRLVGSSGR